jgi:hypothetical protein
MCLSVKVWGQAQTCTRLWCQSSQILHRPPPWQLWAYLSMLLGRVRPQCGSRLGSSGTTGTFYRQNRSMSHCYPETLDSFPTHASHDGRTLDSCSRLPDMLPLASPIMSTLLASAAYPLTTLSLLALGFFDPSRILKTLKAHCLAVANGTPPARLLSLSPTVSWSRCRRSPVWPTDGPAHCASYSSSVSPNPTTALSPP